MSFIKNLTEKLIELEFRPIKNFYDNSIIGDKTEYLGFVKQVGGISYCIVIINADLKYDYKGFYKDALGFLKQLNKTVTTGIFVSENVSDDLMNFTDNAVEDYQDDHIEIRWIADTGNNKIIVNNSQPSKLLGIEKCIKNSFDNASDNKEQDLQALMQKNVAKNTSMLKSKDIALSLSLIIINGLIFLLTIFSSNSLFSANGLFDSDLIYKYAISESIVSKGEWYRLITYMFLHGGIIHYVSNALSIFIFGSRVERYFGKKYMIFAYILSGIVAGLFSLIFSGGVSVGASGAISGLIGSVLVYTKKQNRSADGIDNYIMLLFVVIIIGSGFLMPNVDNWAHIGGFVAGLNISLAYFNLKNRRKKYD